MDLAACLACKSKRRCFLPGTLLRGTPICLQRGRYQSPGLEEQPGRPSASMCSFRNGPVFGKPPLLILNFGSAYASKFLFLDAAVEKLCYSDLCQREMVGSIIA